MCVCVYVSLFTSILQKYDSTFFHIISKTAEILFHIITPVNNILTPENDIKELKPPLNLNKIVVGLAFQDTDWVDNVVYHFN